MTNMRVLVSAPYMLPEMARFTDFMAGAGLEVLLADVQERLSEQELLRYAGKIDGVISGDDQFTEKVIEAAAPRLKVISKWGTGIDSIDRQAAERFHVQIFNSPGAFTDAVADSVMGYVLCFARGLPWLDRAVKENYWVKRPGVALNESTLGVVGVGRIGKAVLQRAKSFGARLLGSDIIEIDSTFINSVGVEMVSLDILLERSDFVSLNCDLNPTSRHLINAERIELMSPGSVLINTARGPIVDESALIAALESGRLAGAALDVFEREPLPQDSPLKEMDNVLLGPHNANSSPSAWERVHINTLRSLFKGLGLAWPDAQELSAEIDRQ